MCSTLSADTVKTCTALGYAYASYTEAQHILFEAEREMSFVLTRKNAAGTGNHVLCEAENNSSRRSKISRAIV